MAKQGKIKVFGEVRLLEHPRFKYTQNQKLEVTVQVCCSESYQPDPTQQPIERTDTMHLRVFGNSAEAFIKSVTKGMRISFEGRLRIERWEKDGHWNCMPITVASEWSFMDTKAKNQEIIAKHGLAQYPALNNQSAHNAGYQDQSQNTPYNQRPAGSQAPAAQRDGLASNVMNSAPSYPRKGV